MKPFRFKPYYKTTLWGGEKIAAFKDIRTSLRNIGESWEISGVPGHESIVTEGGASDGSDLGLTLPRLIDKYKEQLVGRRVYEKFGNQFPLLVKLIDAHQDLSIQVHPDDHLALQRHHCMGKTEIWYIIQADQDARIYTGLHQTVSPHGLVSAATAPVQDGHSPLMDIINTEESHAGDVFFIPAGRLHAIGAGNLLAEIQQSSDITYRVYDFDRRDGNGQARELHVDMARDAIDYTVYDHYRTPYDRTQPVSPLVSCPYFTVRLLNVEGDTHIDATCDSFLILLCTQGRAQVGDTPIRQGDTLLVPACDRVLHLTGQATLLTASLE